MQEKLNLLWQQILANLRIIIFVVFAIMLGFVVYLQISESPDVQGSVASAAGDVEQPEDYGDSDEVLSERLLGENEPIERSRYAYLIRDSMFNVKAIQDAIKQESEANEKFQEALRARGQGNLEGALELCNEALTIRPQHLRARQLRAELRQELGLADEPEADAQPDAEEPAPDATSPPASQP